jgi:hypothetical protein
LYDKNENSIREVMKNKENIRANFSVAPQIAKVTAIAREKVLMVVEKNPLNYRIRGSRNANILGILDVHRCHDVNGNRISLSF